MSFQQNAQGPRGSGGPIDEEARWQAYQAWLRKKREGAGAAEPRAPASEPPPPDPTKVSVQVLNTDGTPDTTAIAIFTNTSGNVVVDTQVDIYGEAAA